MTGMEGEKIPLNPRGFAQGMDQEPTHLCDQQRLTPSSRMLGIGKIRIIWSHCIPRAHILSHRSHKKTKTDAEVAKQCGNAHISLRLVIRTEQQSCDVIPTMYLLAFKSKPQITVKRERNQRWFGGASNLVVTHLSTPSYTYSSILEHVISV